MGGRDRPASSTEISAPFWRETVKKRRRPSSDETLTPRDELAGFSGAREKARRPTRWALVPCMRRGGPCVGLAWNDETTPTLRASADRRRRPRDGRRGVAIPLLVCASRVGRDFFLKAYDRLPSQRTSGFRHGASSSKAGELHGIEGSRRRVGRVRQAENLARLPPLRQFRCPIPTRDLLRSPP